MSILYSIQPHTACNLPTNGKHIVAQTKDDLIVVYQAFRDEIANYAVSNQQFGGAFSFNRMSWIKPNFLWMMYRSGWSYKEGQENILAIWLTKGFFEAILRESVASSFDASQYATFDHWKEELNSKEVRHQWDPDHDPFGKPMSRRAIQLGLKGSMLKRYGTEEIVHIKNITPFVHEQFEHVRSGRLENLMVPIEQVYEPHDQTIITKLAIHQL